MVTPKNLFQIAIFPAVVKMVLNVKFGVQSLLVLLAVNGVCLMCLKVFMAGVFLMRF